LLITLLLQVALRAVAALPQVVEAVEVVEQAVCAQLLLQQEAVVL
jgi:hypothetical protein